MRRLRGHVVIWLRLFLPLQPLILASLVSSTCFAAEQMEPEQKASAVVANAAAPADHDLKRLEDQVTEVRRDQLNYQIEKNLLKEAYASNLETINLALTIGLAITTIVGFLGVRSIGTMRKDFQKELDQLKTLRSEYEKRLSVIEAQQADAVSKVDGLTRVNIEQDQRLRLLELQEKAGQFLVADNPSRALEYVEIGLSLDACNIQLLHLKSMCFFRLSRLRDAIPALKRILELDDSDDGALGNLYECYLLVGDRVGYETLAPRIGPTIVKAPQLSWYFDALKLFWAPDASGLERHAKSMMDTPGVGETGMTWSFSEFRSAFGSLADGRERLVLFKIVEVLERKKTRAQAGEELWPVTESAS